MLEQLRRILGRERNPERMREEAESRLRAEQELRQAERRKSDDQRGLEGIQRGMPYGRP
jgi:hypothetical protein